MVDYTKIRVHEGSQNNGFEELVCQLAHLQKPETGKTFIRKEGAGGDAGIECYWKLEDNCEIGWQAKYFIGGMDDSRWQQLDESFKVALEKHSNLTKYVVCLPLDKTDSRKKGRGGKQVVSIQDEWDARIVTWSKLAKEQNREIEFEFWGKHDLTLLLTIDDPLYSGRALYWFNEPILGFDIFQSIVRISRDSLGERYTPEFHVDLPITKRFDSLCASPEWWARIKKEKEKLVDQKEQFFGKFFGKDYGFLDRKQVIKLEQVCSNLIFFLAQCIKQKSLMQHIDEIRNLCERIQNYQKATVKEDKKDLFHNEEFNDEYRLFQNFFYEYRDFLTFLNSRPVKAGEVRAALMYGEAGIGKSHLLCDMSLHRLEGKLPTVFLLGQHYEGSDPIQTLKNALDLSNHSNKQVLGALDAAGEAYKTQSLIIVDAINEGNHRDDWHNHIRAFLNEISAYKNISVLLSCRTTYLDYS